MIIHYLKIAWRNLLKYKTQNIISIVGLAMGFTAFSFTMSWIRYENGYDSHNPYADRIYCIINAGNSNYNHTSYGLSLYLRETFPEVAASSNVISNQYILSDEQIKTEWDRFVKDCRFSVYTDTAFFSVFYPDTKVIFPDPLPEDATIVSRSVAEKWSISPEKIGQKIDSLDLTPIGIVDDKPLPGNVAFGWISFNNPFDNNNVQNLWNYYSGYTYIRLHKGTSIENIQNQLDSLKVTTINGEEIRSYKIYPLRKLHHLDLNNEANIKYEALKQFSGVALLVTIVALINYIMLFISRVRTRSREFALNKVNGASNKDILLLLLCEFLIVLLAAIFIGGVFTELLFPVFSHFSMILANKSYFLVSVFWYSLIIVTVSVLVVLILVYGLVRKTIRENIETANKSFHPLGITFSHISIFLQLCIGVLLIFCTSIVFNQYHLMDQRVGYNRNNLMVYGTNKRDNIPVSEIKKIPEIGDFIINSRGIFAWSRGRSLAERTIVDKEQKEEKHFFATKLVNSNFRIFLEIPLLKGRDILPSEDAAYFVNATADRLLGNDAIGKTIWGIPIIGVIPDLQVESPLVKIEPVLYLLSSRDNDVQMCDDIVIRCQNDSVRKKVFNRFTEMFPPTINTEQGFSSFNFFTMDIDELFLEFTKSERNLLMLIAIMTGVAILIAVFGIYSMITLACNRRRREIAIRKVNGAKAKEIFLLFFKEYFMVTLLSCMVAFPVGIYVMQRWLEQYTRRIAMEWWIFAGIIVLVLLLVLASIFFRVNKAARENPAEVVKGE